MDDSTEDQGLLAAKSCDETEPVRGLAPRVLDGTTTLNWYPPETEALDAISELELTGQITEHEARRRATFLATFGAMHEEAAITGYDSDDDSDKNNYCLSLSGSTCLLPYLECCVVGALCARRCWQRLRHCSCFRLTCSSRSGNSNSNSNISSSTSSSVSQAKS